MIVVFADRPSPRLDYVLQFIFKQYYNIPYTLLFNEETFSKSEGFRINYSNKILDADFHIHPYPDIYSERIRKIEVTVGSKEQFKTLFHDHRGTWGFDLFFAVFFLLSRYEEYWPHDKDEHGRYRCKNSILFRVQGLNTPWINIWLNYFYQVVKQSQKAENISLPKYKWIPTLDIDRMYAYRKHHLDRNLGGLVRSLVQGNTNDASYRFNVVTGRSRDPYDVYDDLVDMHRHVAEKRIFVLTHQKRTDYDRNLSPEKKEFRNIVKRLNQNFDIGIHPSYFSFEKDLLEKEIRALEEIIEGKVHSSRFHYLRFSLPDHYDYLIKKGIQHDYSMGYAENTGYRAGVAHPFYFFDLRNNNATSLLIHPFAAMDVTLKNYLGYDTNQASAHLKSMIETARLYHCQFSTLWHNESLSEYAEWKGWKKVYERLIAQAS